MWQYDVADDDAMQHHDIEPLPNGNVLILAWERKTACRGARRRSQPEAAVEQGAVAREDHRVLPRDQDGRVGVARVGPRRAGARSHARQLRRRLRPSREDQPELRASGLHRRRRLEPRQRGRLQRRARPDHDQLPLLQRVLDHRPRRHHRGSARSGGRPPLPLREPRGVRQGRTRRPATLRPTQLALDSRGLSGRGRDPRVQQRTAGDPRVLERRADSAHDGRTAST